MANSLTGDYEAVLEIAIRQINGVLGTLHQNGASGTLPLEFDRPNLECAAIGRRGSLI